jgi:hemin uptake protein HemP
MEDRAVTQTSMASGQPVAPYPQSGSTRRVTSTSLLQGQRVIVIEHSGREYRLRLTSNGKLILTG